MQAWVLGNPDQLSLREKPVPVPARAEVLVRIDAVAICATDLEIIHSGSPASIQGGLPFNKNFTPGHEYMGTVAALGPDVSKFPIESGSFREVTRTILTSPEFLSPDAYRAKVKTPFEFVVSALRATGAEVQDARPLVREVQQLGMPLYMCQPPTGYKDTGDAWVNTGALVSRMNLALRLAAGQLRGTTVDAAAIRSPRSAVDGFLTATSRRRRARRLPRRPTRRR